MSRPAATAGHHALHPGYERHRPEDTVLHAVVQAEIETFLACGILAHGFLRAHCDTCGHNRLVAFSCKGRGFWP